MRFLLTNDDGIDAIGIKFLEKALLRYGDVVVVAPTYQQSAKSCSITCFQGVNIREIDENHLSLDGTPVDCVEAGCAMFPDIDVVISGCNNGYNLASDIIYSGTCGAAISGLLANKKTIAFSIGYPNDDPTKIEDYALKSLDFIFKNNLLSNDYYLNVNFPLNEYKGIKLTKVQKDLKESYYLKEKDGLSFFYRSRLNQSNEENIDNIAVEKGYISISPLSLLGFDEKTYKNISKKIK